MTYLKTHAILIQRNNSFTINQCRVGWNKLATLVYYLKLWKRALCISIFSGWQTEKAKQPGYKPPVMGEPDTDTDTDTDTDDYDAENS